MDCDGYRSNYTAYSKLPLPREIVDSPEWSEWMDHFHDCTHCFDWALAQRIKQRGFNPDEFPCVHIGNQVTIKCPDHPEPTDCPDIIIVYYAKFDEYSIAVRDGGSSAVAIRYCPWCGIELPKSKRELWFEQLDALGFDDIHADDIPPEYLTDAWYRNAR